MRAILIKVLALSLSIAAFAPVWAATPHRAKARHSAIHRNHDPMRSFAAPTSTVDPLHPPVLEDQTPSYDDPSKFGGG